MVTKQNHDIGDHKTHFKQSKNVDLTNGFDSILAGKEPKKMAPKVNRPTNNKTPEQLQKENGNMPTASDPIKNADEAVKYLNSKKGNHNWMVDHGTAGMSSPVYWTLSGDNGESWMVYASGEIKPFG